MKVLPQSRLRYFCSVVLVFLLSQGAICIEDGIDISDKPRSQPIPLSTDSSSDPQIAGANEKDVEIESTPKHQPSTDGSTVNHIEKTTRKSSLSQDNIPQNTGLPEHSTDSTIFKPFSTLNNTPLSLVNKTSPSTPSNENSTTPASQLPSVAPTVPVHRKSKPEETHVDEIVRDSGPTSDYVVPLVVAMLAVPLVGVLCALLYMKGRDFWERRHYGRIDFLWESRNDNRMDFLIDGMYRE